MSTETDAAGVQNIIEIATAAAHPTEVPPFTEGLLIHTLPDGGKVAVTDVTRLLEPYQDHPRRKVGARKAHNPEAFAAYLNRHAADDGAEVWTDAVRQRIVGIVNSHERVGGVPGWGDHTIEYDVQTTVGWKAWMVLDGEWLPQQRFAEHIEDRAIDVVDPSAADMLELAQTFKATMGVSMKSAKVLTSGETQVEYREDIEANGGKAGNMVIPATFKLALKPFEGAKTYAVTARFRYRLNGGNLAMSYRLERPEDVLREAFDDVVDTVDELIDEKIALYQGSPA